MAKIRKNITRRSNNSTRNAERIHFSQILLLIKVLPCPASFFQTDLLVVVIVDNLNSPLKDLDHHH